MRMTLQELQGTIEALLFASGSPVSLEELTRIIQADEETIQIMIERMQEDMQERKSGLQIIQVGRAYQMCTREEQFEAVSKLVEPRRQQSLSNAALETLSIVAYNQPVTRSNIEFIRGVNSDGALSRLLEKGLVTDCGRLDTPGKPLLYKTTDEFLRCFGLKTLEDLPDIQNVPLQTSFYDKDEEH